MKDSKENSKKSFVPNYFIWLDPKEQKKRARQLSKITKKGEKTSK